MLGPYITPCALAVSCTATTQVLPVIGLGALMRLQQELGSVEDVGSFALYLASRLGRLVVIRSWLPSSRTAAARYFTPPHVTDAQARHYVQEDLTLGSAAISILPACPRNLTTSSSTRRRCPPPGLGHLGPLRPDPGHLRASLVIFGPEWSSLGPP
jgi:hypothetical protein